MIPGIIVEGAWGNNKLIVTQIQIQTGNSEEESVGAKGNRRTRDIPIQTQGLSSKRSRLSEPHVHDQVMTRDRIKTQDLPWISKSFNKLW